MARRKPTDPQEIARQRQLAESRREAKDETKRLQATGCEATMYLIRDETKTRWAVKAERKDVFRVMLDRRAISQEHFDAVREFQYDSALAQGLTTPKREEIRGSIEGAPGQNITQAIVNAGKRAARVKAAMYPRHYKLLLALLDDFKGSTSQWRATVQSHTCETNDRAQTAIVREIARSVYEARTQRKEAA